MIAAEVDELGPEGRNIRPGISASIITELTDCNAALSQLRKKRQVFIPLTLIFAAFHNIGGSLGTTMKFRNFNLVWHLFSDFFYTSSRGCC